VLVVGRDQARGDECGVGRRSAGRGGTRGDDSRELDLGLDRAVLLEVPVVPVLVVADGGHEREHEPAAAPHLGLAGTPVDVLPQQRGVLLVQADGVAENLGLAGGVDEHGVEVTNLAEAVAPELERVGEHPDPVLADVERVFPAVGRRDLAVRHDHLRERRAVENRSELVAVLVGDGVKDESLAGGEPDPHPPLLPADLVALHREARALGLGDFDRA
jgi:hypothetical protein